MSDSETPFRILSGRTTDRPDFLAQDPVLQGLLTRWMKPEALAWWKPSLERLGARVPGPVSAFAAIADHQSPQLRTHDRFGDRIDEVVHHPAYREMEKIAYGSGMIGLKYDPDVRRRFTGDLQTGSFAMVYLFAQAESGLTCPACMTDGVARVLELFGSRAQQAEYVPRLASRDVGRLLRGAMFLTEKQGGSDVGTNATRARPMPDGSWRLTGEKWFCSNVDAELALVLARPDGAPEGTKGLGLFLVRRDRPDGRRNGLRVDRIKDKLGVRSMATGEVVLEESEAELVGELRAGFKQMAEMLNLSRLYNAVCSVAIERRALFEAVDWLRARRTFGRRGTEHPLLRETLADLAADWAAGLHLVLRIAQALEAGDGGSARDRALVRILTPLAKYSTAKQAVAAASEGIEAVGGNAYIEEHILSRLLRDAQVLPVWEGTTNILVLDTLRACAKTGAHEVLRDEIGRLCSGAPAGMTLEAQGALALAEKAAADLATVAEAGPERAPRHLRAFADRMVLATEVALLLGSAGANGPAGAIAAAAARRLLRRADHGEAESAPDDLAALVDQTVTPV